MRPLLTSPAAPSRIPRRTFDAGSVIVMACSGSGNGGHGYGAILSLRVCNNCLPGKLLSKLYRTTSV